MMIISFFLQKIINQHVDLPTKLSSIHVWDSLINRLNEEFTKTEVELFNSDSMDNIVKKIGIIFIKNKMTERNASLFLDKLKRHYFKLYYNEIVFEQVFVIIYLYLFNRSLYDIILSNKITLTGYDTKEKKRYLIKTIDDEHPEYSNIIIDDIFKLKRDDSVQHIDNSIFMQPPIYEVDAFDKYFPNNILSGYKTHDFEAIFSQDKDDFLSWFIEQKDISIFKYYLIGISENSINPQILLKATRNIIYTFLNERENKLDKVHFLGLNKTSTLFYSLTDYIKKSNNNQEIKTYDYLINNYEYSDVSEKLYIMIATIYDEELRIEIFYKILEASETHQLTLQRFPSQLLALYNKYRNPENPLYDDILDELLNMSTNEFFNFITNDYSSTINSSVGSAKKTIRIDDLYVNDKYREKFDKKIDEFTLRQAELIEEYKNNSNGFI